VYLSQNVHGSTSAGCALALTNALPQEFRVMQAFSIAIDAAQEVLRDPTAPILLERKEVDEAREVIATTRALNNQLHDDIRALQRQLEDSQEEAARRQLMHRAPLPALPPAPFPALPPSLRCHAL
jgi:septal ring factor EnvC (AmiA/AmiB activator)